MTANVRGPGDHAAHRFDEDLEALRETVVRTGALGESQLAESVRIPRDMPRHAGRGRDAPLGTEVRHLGQRVRRTLRDALDVFVRLDPERAARVVEEDRAVDRVRGKDLRHTSIEQVRRRGRRGRLSGKGHDVSVI